MDQLKFILTGIAVFILVFLMMSAVMPRLGFVKSPFQGITDDTANLKPYYSFNSKDNAFEFRGYEFLDYIQVEVIKGFDDVIKDVAPKIESGSDPGQGIIFHNFKLSFSYTDGLGHIKQIPSQSIKHIFINFKVDDNWLTANSLAKYDIEFYYYNSTAWKSKSVSYLRKENNDNYFQASHDSDGVFAIVGIK
ncbi:MAG: PGF-pre-PGF domain-containing protein [Nanoarchaeota archaeon]